MNVKYKTAFNEVSQIISLLSEEDRNKLNENFVKFIEKNKSSFNDIDIVANTPLEQQNISEETKALLYILLKTGKK